MLVQLADVDRGVALTVVALMIAVVAATRWLVFGVLLPNRAAGEPIDASPADTAETT